jgi:hypothetical protein
VVKEVDSKSTGLCPREFESRRCRFFFSFLLLVVLIARPASGTTRSVRGLVVMIVACQVMDPGSIPGERNFLSFVGS